MKIIKRNGQEVNNDPSKISNAIRKANDELKHSGADSKFCLTDDDILAITDDVESQMEAMGRAVSVEEIQDMVEQAIMGKGKYRLAKAYITYRYIHQIGRSTTALDGKIMALIECENEEVKQENSNKNPTIVSVQRDYMAGELSKDLTERFFLPKEVTQAHKDGVIHFHDSDYFSQHMGNCCLVNLKDMLENGTVISETMIEPPKSFLTAANVTTQIIAQVASSQYGGQSITLAHLAPFVDISRQKLRKIVRKEQEMIHGDASDKTVNAIAESRLLTEIKSGIQLIQYQVTTLMTTNGQAPFITVFMYINEVPEGQMRDDLVLLIKEMLNQRILGVKNEKGVYITPAFPKLVYVLSENNIMPDSDYYEVTELAAKCTAKRMVPDYVSEKIMKSLKIDGNGGQCYPPMGCRSFLTPYTTEEGESKYYGRFNQGVVTLNLVDVACSSGKDMETFWKILDERLELCHTALYARHKRLEGTLSDVAPILWQHGALARLKKGEKIDKYLHGGYSTISLGYAGLCEMTYFMKGVSHTDEKGKEFALAVMKRLNDACASWKEQDDIAYSLYGTPLESTTYKFAKCLQKKFGKIPHVTDKNYITNSYHVHVTEKIDAFTKLSFESQFQALSPGGAISYVEVPNLEENLGAVLAVMKHIYENIMYAELNTKSDYCHVCDYTGQIQIVEEGGKLIWKCPNCGNTDQNKMNVARRTCGYIGTQFWNQGRTQEIKERVMHL